MTAPVAIEHAISPPEPAAHGTESHTGDDAPLSDEGFPSCVAPTASTYGDVAG